MEAYKWFNLASAQGDEEAKKNLPIIESWMTPEQIAEAHYTLVMLNTPRQHKNPYFGFGSPETAKLVILENVGGVAYPLQNATIWEKSKGFIVVTALGKEWIYFGTYTIQN